MIGLKEVCRFLTDNTSLSTSVVNPSHPNKWQHGYSLLWKSGWPVPNPTHLLQKSNRHLLTCFTPRKKGAETPFDISQTRLSYFELKTKILSIEAFSQLRYHLFLT